MRIHLHYGLLLSLCLLIGLGKLPAMADSPVVHAILFYSPSCGHCHHVINEVLPPIMEQHGNQIIIVGVNVSDADGQALYQAAIDHFAISADRRGVPTLIIGDAVLVGSGEIPEQLPGLIESYLAQGGVDWPAIPGLAEALTASATEAAVTPTDAGPTATPISAATPILTATAIPVATTAPVIPGVVQETWQMRFARDPLGNSISVLVLLGMLISVIYQGLMLSRTPSEATVNGWTVPLLVVLGLGVAGYLAYVETQQVAAVCGPVGDCNAVQQSQFALLFGFLPIAVLGVIGYIAIGASWMAACFMSVPWKNWAKLALVGMVWFGIGFSIYLTFLEPFVIGATCAWCLTSAVIMTLLFWLIAPLAHPTLVALRAG